MGPLASALTCLSFSFLLCKMHLTMRPMCGAVGEAPTDKACRVQAWPGSSHCTADCGYHCADDSIVSGGVKDQAGGDEAGRTFWALSGSCGASNLTLSPALSRRTGTWSLTQLFTRAHSVWKRMKCHDGGFLAESLGMVELQGAASAETFSRGCLRLVQGTSPLGPEYGAYGPGSELSPGT